MNKILSWGYNCFCTIDPLDLFKSACYSSPNWALELIVEHPDLAKKVPFDFMLTLARTNQPLYEAYCYHKTPPSHDDILAALIDNGANVDGTEAITGYTLLHAALERGLVKTAERLVGRGLDNKNLSSGIAPIHLAAQDGKRLGKVLSKLAENNEVLHARTCRGSTALHLAAESKSLEGTYRLIKAGIDLNTENSAHFTALKVAKLVADNMPVVELLLASPQNANAIFLKHCPMRPVELIRNGNYENALYQLQQGDILSGDDFIALLNTHRHRIYQLLKDFPQVAQQLSGNVVVKLLKSQPYDPTYHDICLKLITLGIKVDGSLEETHQQALHIAAFYGLYEIVEALIKAGSCLNAKDKAGNTPLHSSAESNSLSNNKVLTLLLAMGANPMLVNNRGQLPYYVTQSGSWKLAYIKHSLPSFSSFTIGDYQRILDAVKAEFSHSSFVQSCCKEASTPLETILLLDLSASSVMAFMTEEQKLHGIHLLLKKYPGAHDVILIKFFDTNVAHILAPTILNTNPPKTANKQDRNELIIRFRSLQGIHQAQQIQNDLHTFLNRVEKKEAFSGTPKATTDALNDFYRIIRRSLNNLVLYINAKPQADREVLDIAKKLSEASSFCGMQYLTAALDLFNTYCLNIKPTLQSAFLEQLQVLRGLVIQKMLSEPYVRQAQGSHAIAHFKHLLGEDLQLGDRQAYREEDVYKASGFKEGEFPSDDKVRKSFYIRYTPNAIYDWMYNLLADERYRNFYIDWVKENLHGITTDELFVENSFEPNHYVLILTLIKLEAIQFKKLLN